MRKFAGVFFASAMVLSLGLVAAAPSGAAAVKGTTCTAPSGTIKILPGLTATPKVQTITFNLPLKGCTGTVKTGSVKGTEKTTAISTGTFAKGKPLPLSATITWNTKATTGFTATAKTTTTKTGITYVISSKISKGLFKGLTLTTSGAIGFGAPGANKAISNLTLKGTKPLTIK
jgi:hypothetical protein